MSVTVVSPCRSARKRKNGKTGTLLATYDDEYRRVNGHWLFAAPHPPHHRSHDHLTPAAIVRSARGVATAVTVAFAGWTCCPNTTRAVPAAAMRPRRHKGS